MKYLSLIALFLLPHFSQAAAGNACLDSDRVNREVLNHFEFQNPAGSDVEINLCDPANGPRHVIEAILFLKDLPKLQTHADEFDLGKMNAGPFEYFRKRIHTFRFETSEQRDCAEGALAWVAGSLSAPDGIMHVCPSLASDELLDTSTTLVHEARHQEGYPHVQCDHGSASGGMNCDSSYSEGGSYGIETEYQVKVSRAKGLNPVLRQTARSAAIYNFVSRFNDLPLGITRGAALLDERDQLSFYDGKRRIPMFRSPFSNAKPLLHRNMLELLDPRTGHSYRAMDGMALEKNPIAYKDNEGGMIDYFGSTAAHCLLYPRKLACFFADGSRLDTPLDFTAYGYGLATAEYGTVLVITSTTGDVYEFYLTGATFAIRKNPDFKSLLFLGGWKTENTLFYGDNLDLIGMTTDHRVRMFKGVHHPEGEAAPLLGDERFQSMLFPFYWSPELQKL